MNKASSKQVMVIFSVADNIDDVTSTGGNETVNCGDDPDIPIVIAASLFIQFIHSVHSFYAYFDMV